MGVNARAVTRRKFLRGGGLVGASVAGTVAMPQVSRAQTTTFMYQSAWPSKDIFHEFAADYVRKVNEMSGGRLKLNLLPAGSVVPAFQLHESIHKGVLDGGHGVTANLFGKHKAAALFGTPPSFGWDAHGFLAWFYHGGGEDLYKELVNGILKLNLVSFLCFPMPTQPLGWFKKEITTSEEFKGLKYRTDGLPGDLFKDMGAVVISMPGGEVVPAFDRGSIEAAASNNPTSDLMLGFPDVSRHYMVGSHHKQTETCEVIFNTCLSP